MEFAVSGVITDMVPTHGIHEFRNLAGTPKLAKLCKRQTLRIKVCMTKNLLLQYKCVEQTRWNN